MSEATQKIPNVTPLERKVLRVLAGYFNEDGGVLCFREIQKKARLPRAKVRLGCRSLKRKGYAEFFRGCWTEDGEPAGSGYRCTNAGYERAEQLKLKLIEPYWW